ncbi:hypothetical protein AMATHDRAFT_77087 [Amanita thiersii Skay4041]|uniref:DUF1690 domain-containing protein n=1 Tax=Amanita thiersii Skay4041 TaxID=703135 RepID=A0A2A9NAL6_9AGAR|nr:hypothetical protein AMATHDRAFT_77087 [Amanita thiersii Skay4041]
MGANQSAVDQKVFHNETPISFSQDVVNQLSDRLESSDVPSERHSSLDAHIRSRIQAELDHLRKEEEQVRQEIESALQAENMDRERAMAGSASSEQEDTAGNIASSPALFGDIERIRSAIDHYTHKQLSAASEMENVTKAVVSCYRSHQTSPLDCWKQIQSFKAVAASMEQEYLQTLKS